MPFWLSPVTMVIIVTVVTIGIVAIVRNVCAVTINRVNARAEVEKTRLMYEEDYEEDEDATA